MDAAWILLHCWAPCMLVIGSLLAVIWGFLRQAEGHRSGRVLVGLGVVGLLVGATVVGLLMMGAGGKGEPPQL
jgi:hypothetical protein